MFSFQYSYKVVQPSPLPNTRTISSPQKKKKKIPGSLNSHPIPLLPTSPWQQRICFLSLWICLFWTCHINEITGGLVCLAPFTRHNGFEVSPYCSTHQHLILFAGYVNSPLYGHTTLCQLMNMWAVSTIWLPRIIMLL